MLVGAASGEQEHKHRQVIARVSFSMLATVACSAPNAAALTFGVDGAVILGGEALGLFTCCFADGGGAPIGVFTIDGVTSSTVEKWHGSVS